jgi:hypothetical protein
MSEGAEASGRTQNDAPAGELRFGAALTAGQTDLANERLLARFAADRARLMRLLFQ